VGLAVRGVGKGVGLPVTGAGVGFGVGEYVATIGVGYGVTGVGNAVGCGVGYGVGGGGVGCGEVEKLSPQRTFFFLDRSPHLHVQCLQLAAPQWRQRRLLSLQ
jgi:hypothetical protein